MGPTTYHLLNNVTRAIAITRLGEWLSKNALVKHFSVEITEGFHGGAVKIEVRE